MTFLAIAFFLGAIPANFINHLSGLPFLFLTGLVAIASVLSMRAFYRLGDDNLWPALLSVFLGGTCVISWALALQLLPN